MRIFANDKFLILFIFFLLVFLLIITFLFSWNFFYEFFYIPSLNCNFLTYNKFKDFNLEYSKNFLFFFELLANGKI